MLLDGVLDLKGERMVDCGWKGSVATVLLGGWYVVRWFTAVYLCDEVT